MATRVEVQLPVFPDAVGVVVVLSLASVDWVVNNLPLAFPSLEMVIAESSVGSSPPNSKAVPVAA